MEAREVSIRVLCQELDRQMLRGAPDDWGIASQALHNMLQALASHAGDTIVNISTPLSIITAFRAFEAVPSVTEDLPILEKRLLAVAS